MLRESRSDHTNPKDRQWKAIVEQYRSRLRIGERWVSAPWGLPIAAATLTIAMT
jgi:hypothetical protein